MIELHTWFRRAGVDKGIQTHQKIHKQYKKRNTRMKNEAVFTAIS